MEKEINFEQLAKEVNYNPLALQQQSGYSRAQVYYKLRQIKRQNQSSTLVVENPTNFTNPSPEAPEAPEAPDLSSFIPNKVDNFIDRQHTSLLDICYQSKLIPLLVGNAGSGKTESVKQFAACKQLPFLRISFSESSNADDLFGSLTIRNGNIEFLPSLLYHFLKSESVILFDEINAMLPEFTFLLHQLFDSRSIYIKQANEVLDMHERCFIALAMNPPSRVYVGTKKLNLAFLDRLTIINVDDLSIDDLKSIYKSSFQSTSECDQIFKFYADLRKLAEDNQFSISIRAMQKYIALRKMNLSVMQSVEIAFFNFIDIAKNSDVKKAATTIAKMHIKQQEMKK